jgi:hypothetical protein
MPSMNIQVVISSCRPFFKQIGCQLSLEKKNLDTVAIVLQPLVPRWRMKKEKLTKNIPGSLHSLGSL